MFVFVFMVVSFLFVKNAEGLFDNVIMVIGGPPSWVRMGSEWVICHVDSTLWYGHVVRPSSESYWLSFLEQSAAHQR